MLEIKQGKIEDYLKNYSFKEYKGYEGKKNLKHTGTLEQQLVNTKRLYMDALYGEGVRAEGDLLKVLVKYNNVMKALITLSQSLIVQRGLYSGEVVSEYENNFKLHQQLEKDILTIFQGKEK